MQAADTIRFPGATAAGEHITTLLRAEEPGAPLADAAYFARFGGL